MSLLLVGCAGQQAGAPAPSPSATAAPHTATSAPVSPTPTVETGPASWRITFDGIGPLAAGAAMTEVPAQLAGYRQLSGPDDQCNAYVYELVHGLNASVRAERADPSSAAESTVYWKGNGAPAASDLATSPRTAAGVGIGTSIGDLKAAYPDLKVTQESHVPTYGISDGARWILFRDLYAGGTVTAVQVGTNTTIANEVC